MSEAATLDERWDRPDLAYVHMVSTNHTATKGDWLVWSGSAVVGGGAGPTAYYMASGIGVALDNNPGWMPDGSAYFNTAMPVKTMGMLRVTGQGSATAGMNCWPVTTGSGIIGQTGRTGEHACWTAAYEVLGISALGGAQVSGSALNQSGVARIVRVVTRAVSGVWDVELIPPVLLRGLGGVLPQGGA